MAISRKKKEELVAHYGELIDNTSGFVITEYRGLTVAQISQLRNKLREIDAKYVVTKNTLLKRTLTDAGWPVPEELLVGPVAVAIANGNFPGTAKAVFEFAKEFPDILVVKGGIMDGEVLDVSSVKAISELPSMDELRAQLAGLLVQPATGLVSVLNSATGSLVNVLQAYVQENSDDAA
ncbi:MAG: 50S ribosomal protein L10 [Chloroflexi bacterium]|nr:MAG: 50S ribosomal protein L10 [Chloroflexota bacterium]